MPELPKRWKAKKRSVVAPFDFLTLEFWSSFRCAKPVRIGSGVDFGARSGGFLARLGNIAKIDQNLGLENMKFGLFWVVVAPFGLGLAVVRGTGPKFHYRPLFGHMGPPRAQNGPFSGFWVTSGFWQASCPLGPWALFGVLRWGHRPILGHIGPPGTQHRPFGREEVWLPCALG